MPAAPAAGMLRKIALLLPLAALLSACLADDVGAPALPELEAGEPPPEVAADTVVRSCADIDASGLRRETSAEHAARWDGVACAAPLAGGQHSGSFFECGYGGDPGVCGESSGLQLFGCRCEAGRLRCQDGVAIAAHEAAIACPADAGAGSR